MMHVSMSRSQKTANISRESGRPKHRPGRLGRSVDYSLQLVASWPPKDRRSVEVRRPGPHGIAADEHGRRT